ncbi:MAG: hypothetical protein MHPSP_003033, partial [Paramarteilia canceri]
DTMDENTYEKTKKDMKLVKNLISSAQQLTRQNRTLKSTSLLLETKDQLQTVEKYNILFEAIFTECKINFECIENVEN